MSIIQTALDKARQAGGSAGPHGEEAAQDRGVADLPERARRIAVDLEQLRARGEIPEQGEERRFADHYREIKRPLIEKALAAGARANARLMLVTSALPAEGKTFTALNLALSMARERDISVLLVDADMPKAHLSRTFGLQDDPGLLDALADESIDVGSLVVGTDVPGLELLPAGRANDGAAELIASARMSQICARLTGRYPRRMVLLDSAPLLVSSEARALKQIPGQILMVTRAGKTPRQALLDAIALLDKSRLCGLVLNDAHAANGDGYYTHYGYSAYGATGGTGASERPRTRPERRSTR